MPARTQPRCFSRQLLIPAAVLLLTAPLSSTAAASDLPVEPWEPLSLSYGDLEELEGTWPQPGSMTWVTVYPGTSPCDPAPTGAGGDLIAGSGTTIDDVWCFEVPDSLWPLAPAPSRQPNWDHWSANLPLYPPTSRWHTSTFHADAPTGAYSAWLGCDLTEPGTPCADIGFWNQSGGYGNGWDESLLLDASNYGAGTAAVLTMSLRYDLECTYDYLYLEYEHSNTNGFVPVRDGVMPAVFNGVSNSTVSNTSCENGVDGTATDGNFHNAPGAASHTLELWYHGLSFSIPAGTNLRVRWRGQSDKAWSDQDGLLGADTDGMASVDNVVLAFANGDSVTDDFEEGDFLNAIVVTGGVPSTDPNIWKFRLGDNTYDGWHLTFDPSYLGKGATCEFSDDWMMACRNLAGPAPENGFRMMLTTPVIPCQGWTAGIVSYSEYLCMPSGTEDAANRLVRYYDSALGAWSPWNDSDGTAVSGGCTEWTPDQWLDLTPFVGSTVETLQVAWEVCDLSRPWHASWGDHQDVQYLIDNVSIGSYAAGNTAFRFERSELFHDTFSLSDPAHSSELNNDEQGLGAALTAAESLNVTMTDREGLSGPGEVRLHWRLNGGAWSSKLMNLSVQDPSLGPGQGVYRSTIGADSGPEDYSGASGDGLIWSAGTAVDYYVRVVDDLGGVATFPRAAQDPTPRHLQFQVLPFLRDNGFGEHILIVDDFGFGLLDYEKSTGYVPGPPGSPRLQNPVLDEPEDLIEQALACLYPPFDESNPGWDVYNVLVPDSNGQKEPRGLSDSAAGLGGFLDDSGNPIYDAILWVNGDLVCGRFEFRTRIDLRTYLDNGGNLLATGDNVASDLGGGGCGLGAPFLATYLGTSFAGPSDNETTEKILDVAYTGVLPGLAGMKCSIYGECPQDRLFDRLTLAPPPTAPVANGVVGEYDNGDPATDDGRPAIIFNDRDDSVPKNGYTAVLTGFDLSAMVAKSCRADFLAEVFRNCFGLTDMGYQVVGSRGLDVPAVPPAPIRFRLDPAAPNPTSGVARIRFQVGRRGPVELAVYDLAGRRVRTLVSKVLAADAYELAWDARDQGGAPVGSGVYFYRLRAPEFDRVQKVVIVR